MWNGGFVCQYICLLFFWGRSIVTRLIKSWWHSPSPRDFKWLKHDNLEMPWAPEGSRACPDFQFWDMNCSLIFSKISGENVLINNDFLLILHLLSSRYSVVHFPLYFSRSLIEYYCSVRWPELGLEGEQSCAGLFHITSSLLQPLTLSCQQPQQSKLTPKEW